ERYCIKCTTFSGSICLTNVEFFNSFHWNSWPVSIHNLKKWRKQSVRCVFCLCMVWVRLVGRVIGNFSLSFGIPLKGGESLDRWNGESVWKRREP
ncbi:hypothetical protein PMAYCL1PPCAC_09468, partial [Pristionchus mayeri]